MKVLSNLFGPSVFGFLAQLIGITAIFFMCAGGGVTNGLIRNASVACNEAERTEWLRAALTIHLYATLFLAMVAALLFTLSGQAILGASDFAPLLLVIGVAQSVFGLGNILLAYASAVQDWRGFALANIAGNIIYVLGVVGAAAAWGSIGAAYGLVTLPLVTAGIAVVRLALKPGGLGQLGLSRDRSKIATLLGFSGAMIAGVVAVPLAQILIRFDLGGRYTWEWVGYWQAIAKFSDAYMLIYGVLFINVLLPTLARAADFRASSALLARIGTVFLTMFIVGASALYLLRDFAIIVAYSRDFLPASAFVAPQLIADFARVLALCFFYFFLAHGRTWIAAISELYQGIAIYALYALLEPTYGPMAAVYNQIFVYCGLLVSMLALFLHHRWRMGAVR